jgi:hypothetical protein
MIRRALPWWIATGILTIGYIPIEYMVVQVHGNVPVGFLLAFGYMAAAGWFGWQAWWAARTAP